MDVVVVNAMGDEARLDDAFVFIDGGVPSIGSVFPSAGDVNGGTWVSINGSGFGPVSSVFFNGTPAASLELVSASLLRALTPGLPQGQYDVTVAQSGCANDMWATEFGAFDALQLGPDPTIDSVTPHVLSQGGNELLTITGTGFINSAVVELFNDPGTGDGGTALVTTFVSSTELKAATPAGPLPGGDHALVVRFPGGQADLLPDAVEVDAPTLTGVSPAVFAQTGGVTLSITGTEFTDSAVVELFTDLNDFSGGTPLATTFVSEVELLAEVPFSMAPLPAGLANVVVSMDGPLVAALAGGVQILAPSLDSVTPSQLSPSGDEVLTLTGVGFTPDAVVRLFADEGDLSGGTQLVATVVSDTEISVITPIGPLPGGDATLAIDLTGGLVAADVNGVNVLYPSIAAVAPGQLASTGNEVFTVTGSHFVDGLSIVELFTDAVTLEGGTALATTFVNSTTLTAVTPNGPLPLGNVNVAVRMANDVVALAQGALGFSAALSNGNKASGELGDDDPSDEVVFDGLAGTQVTIIQRRVGKTDLIPKLKLVDPDAAVLVSTDEADPEFDAEQVKLTAKSAMLRKVVLPQTGRYRLLIQRESGAGPYKLSFREKLPLEARRIKLSKPDDVTLGPKQHEIVFDAKAGTRITGTFRGSKKDGLKLVLSSLQDPDGVQLLQTLEDGTVLGAQDLIERVTVGKDQISVRLKQVALPAFGSYRMVWSAGGETSGIVTGRFNLRPPKVKATFEL
ncbi:MAG: hypothetical protein DRQ55_14055 [Planctomycetota bacterium]|nr:MAG: hypothetical protein DRQ55_14055 [Planctomycetota bacterium]